MANSLPHVLNELVKDGEKGAELLALSEVGRSELVERDGFVVLVLVVEGVEASGDRI